MEQPPLASLSEQERACLRLVPLRNTAEIARETGLSPETVKTYLRRAREKLGVNRTADAARLLFAVENRPPESGYPSRATDQPDRSSAQQPHQTQGQPAPAVLREERVAFSPASARPCSSADGGATNERHGLNIVLKIAGLIIAMAMVILLAAPLSESAQRLANLIQPPTQ